jgi:hypothetical protein
MFYDWDYAGDCEGTSEMLLDDCNIRVCALGDARVWSNIACSILYGAEFRAWAHLVMWISIDHIPYILNSEAEGSWEYIRQWEHSRKLYSSYFLKTDVTSSVMLFDAEVLKIKANMFSSLDWRKDINTFQISTERV